MVEREVVLLMSLNNSIILGKRTYGYFIILNDEKAYEGLDLENTEKLLKKIHKKNPNKNIAISKNIINEDAALCETLLQECLHIGANNENRRCDANIGRDAYNSEHPKNIKPSQEESLRGRKYEGFKTYSESTDNRIENNSAAEDEYDEEEDEEEDDDDEDFLIWEEDKSSEKSKIQIRALLLSLLSVIPIVAVLFLIIYISVSTKISEGKMVHEIMSSQGLEDVKEYIKERDLQYYDVIKTNNKLSLGNIFQYLSNFDKAFYEDYKYESNTLVIERTAAELDINGDADSIGTLLGDEKHPFLHDKISGNYYNIYFEQLEKDLEDSQIANSKYIIYCNESKARFLDNNTKMFEEACIKKTAN